MIAIKIGSVRGCGLVARSRSLAHAIYDHRLAREGDRQREKERERGRQAKY